MTIRRVTVYCASSTQADPAYHDAAERLGRELAANGMTTYYGGGRVGSMGRLADGALAAGGRVIGILPTFMRKLEWYHPGISELRFVEDMHERKRALLAEADAVVAMPGGSGTLDELIEAISLKRLGFFLGPIVLVNTRRFFDPCLRMLESCIEQRFMHERHRSIWQVVASADEVVPAFGNAPVWSRDAIDFAAI